MRSALVLAPLLILLVSCATPESGQRAESAVRAKDLLAESRHARQPDARIGYALAAAEKASGNLASEDARSIYNAACVEIAMEVGKAGSGVTLPATFTTPSGSYQLAFAASRPSGTWAPSTFEKLLPTTDMKRKEFVSKKPLPGFGGAIVGVDLPPDPRNLYLPRIGASAPVTAVVNFSRPATAGGPTRATLTLYNPAERDTATIADAERPLAADLSAPFGYYRKPGLIGILGALRPLKFLNQEGLFLVQPYDPDKIPIVFIHGLMSDPQIWLPEMAAIESDPELRDHFQFWVFAYPTGNPIAYSAYELRQALDGVYKVYPGTKDMVIVNHSLGGDITHLQVIDPGDVLVKGIFKESAPKIMAMPDDSLVKRALIYEPNRKIDRVVFIAAPHRGAPMAINSIGKLGAALIRLPGKVVSDIGSGVMSAAVAASGSEKPYVPNVITGLSPKSPLLISMNEVPMLVPFHSIIGVAGLPKAPLEKTSDTVVPYTSSHQDAALSEKIVPAPHTSIYDHPETIDEVKRILRLHLKTAAR